MISQSLYQGFLSQRYHLPISILSAGDTYLYKHHCNFSKSNIKHTQCAFFPVCIFLSFLCFIKTALVPFINTIVFILCKIELFTTIFLAQKKLFTTIWHSYHTCYIDAIMVAHRLFNIISANII